MERKQRLLTDWKMTCVFFLVIAVGLAVLYLRTGAAPYRFLDGQELQASRIDEVSGSFYEVQTYQLKGSFEAIGRQVWDELKPLKFEEAREFEVIGWRMFNQVDGPTIIVQGMREDVKVCITRSLPSTWLTKARKWLQPK